MSNAVSPDVGSSVGEINCFLRLLQCWKQTKEEHARFSHNLSRNGHTLVCFRRYAPERPTISACDASCDRIHARRGLGRADYGVGNRFQVEQLQCILHSLFSLKDRRRNWQFEVDRKLNGLAHGGLRTQCVELLDDTNLILQRLNGSS